MERESERERTGETDRQRQRGGEQTQRETDNSREREKLTDRHTKGDNRARNEVMKRFQKQLVSIPQEPNSRRTV